MSDVSSKENKKGKQTAKVANRFVILVSQNRAMQKVTYFCSQRIKRGPSFVDLVYFDQHSFVPVQLRSLGELAHEEERDAAEKLLRFYADNIYAMTKQMPVVHYQAGTRISYLIDILNDPEHADRPTWLVIPMERRGGSEKDLTEELLFKHLDKLHTPIVLLTQDVSYTTIDMMH